MNERIAYRHNVMSIDSLDAFINIKGGCRNGVRDVYFVRALGELPDMKSVILNIDRKMDTAASNNRLMYYRISGLPKSIQGADIEFYSNSYAAWSRGEAVKLRARYSDKLFGEVCAAATRNTVAQYKKIRANMTETIIKNFVIKLWFWTDFLLKDVIAQWTERASVKIIADNITKDQEYLFFYMATLLGCDVLLLNNKSDICLDRRIMELSGELKLGSYGKTELPRYTPNIIEKKQERAAKPREGGMQTAEKVNAGMKQPKNATVNNTDIKQHNAKLNIRAIRKNPAENKKGNAAADAARREKNFEELAQLAASVVMIAVHDRKGEPVETGSGIMIGRQGFILTNYHVIKSGEIYAVRMESDEEVYVTNEIIKINPQLDLAVIRIKKELNPIPIYDGKQKLVRGQKVVAIGSPLGLFNSVSDGIISGFRNIRDVDMIQFTAPISHGSSGGAVLNMYGELIGISTAGIDSGQNINLAVDYENIRFFAKGFY